MAATAPATETDIVNLALDRLGERKINDIDNPDTDIGETMARWYHQIRMECLREQVWNWAQGYSVLARSGAAALGEHADAYPLPNDFIRLNSVGLYRTDPIVDYDINGANLEASNGSTIPIWYNKDIETVSLFDPLFISFFVTRLAEATAFKVTKKKSVADMMTQQNAYATTKAFSVDGQERKPRRIEKSRLLTARRSRGPIIGRDNRYYEYSD